MATITTPMTPGLPPLASDLVMDIAADQTRTLIGVGLGFFFTAVGLLIIAVMVAASQGYGAASLALSVIAFIFFLVGAPCWGVGQMRAMQVM